MFVKRSYQEVAGSAICMKDPVEFFKYGCFSLVGKTCLHLFNALSIRLQKPETQVLFGCSIDAAQHQMALNFESVVTDKLFSVVLAAYK